MRERSITIIAFVATTQQTTPAQLIHEVMDSKTANHYCHHITHPRQERSRQRKKVSPKPNTHGRISNDSKTRKEGQDQKQPQKKKAPGQRSKQSPTAAAITGRENPAASSHTGKVKSTSGGWGGWGGWGLGRKATDSGSFGASRSDAGHKDTEGLEECGVDGNEGFSGHDRVISHPSPKGACDALSLDQQWDKAVRLMQYLD